MLNPEDKLEATEAMKAVVTGLKHGGKGPGCLVQTKHGLGRTFQTEKPVNGKILVYLNDGKKMLCDPAKIEFKGFID